LNVSQDQDVVPSCSAMSELVIPHINCLHK